jgi:hypothetical protein
MRRAGLAALLVLVLAGCGSGRSGPTRLDYHGLGATPVIRVIAQDEIPALDRPRFDRPEALQGLLRSDDLVVGAVVDGQPHAYPLDLLSFHEVVNDGPLAVTWCPLCRTALAFQREVDGRRLTFGVSGLLLHANQVLYDRESGSLWSQLAGRAISGRHRGTRLRPVPLAELTWGQWLHAHPATLVLSIRGDKYATRFTHPYTYFDARGEELSSDPYYSYTQKVSLYYSHGVDGLAGSTLVLGLRIDGVAKAYPIYLLRRPIRDVVAGHRLRIVPDQDALSAVVLEHGKRLPATPVYWFAWHAFYPNTLVHKRPQRRDVRPDAHPKACRVGTRRRRASCARSLRW